MKYILIIGIWSMSGICRAQTTEPISKAAFKTITLAGSPDFLAADGDDVWVTNINRVEKLSASGPVPVMTVDVPDACGDMIVGFNSLWVANCRTKSVYRIDTKTGKVVGLIPTGISDVQGEISLAVGDGAVWILSDSTGVLTRIDPRTNAVATTIKVLPNSYCVAYAFGAVWITNTSANSVQRIDPKTNRVTATIAVGKIPRFLTAGENGVWTLNQGDGTVSRIDPGTNKVAATIYTTVPGSGGDIFAGGGKVWVRAKSERLLQAIDAATNKVEKIYSPFAGSGAVEVTENYVWVTAHDVNKIWILKR